MQIATQGKSKHTQPTDSIHLFLFGWQSTGRMWNTKKIR